jgi:large subunit ribosomal protein L23
MGIFKKEEKPKAIKKAAAPKAKKEAAPVKAEKVEEKKPVVQTVAGGAALKVIVRPLITEKTAVMQSVRTYSFVVKNSANKIQIANAVKELYGVTPVSVRVSNVQGKAVRFGKYAGKRSDYKKAMVTLKPGDSITIHEGV